jgi:hypothetical protein
MNATKFQWRPDDIIVESDREDFGDKQGHPFRGNQWSSAWGHAEKKAIEKKAESKRNGEKLDKIMRGDKKSVTDISIDQRSAAKEDIVSALSDEILRQTEFNEELKAELEAKTKILYPGLKDLKDPSSYPGEAFAAEEVAQGYVDAWAASAADHEPQALALQQSAARVFEAQSDAFDRHVSDSTVLPADPNVGSNSRDLAKALRKVNASDSMLMDTFQEAQYEHTQKFLRDQGIGPTDKVKLYRGMSVQANDQNSPLAQLNAGDVVNVDMNPASSWSTDKQVARDFAVGFAGGAIFEMDVPARDILSTAMTGVGARHEGEIVVLNRDGQQAVVHAQ